MPLFSENDINEAKRRVMEMQNRASDFVGRETAAGKTQDGEKSTNHTSMANESNEKSRKSENAEKNAALTSSDNTGDDNSLFIILALILILSREKADNTLILALLYLLL